VPELAVQPRRVKKALAALLSSKKFVTALTGAAVAIGAKFGLELDNEIVAAIIGLFAVAVGAQGLADHGKEKALIEAKAANDNAAGTDETKAA
jgi:hypothetical protein